MSKRIWKKLMVIACTVLLVQTWLVPANIGAAGEQEAWRPIFADNFSRYGAQNGVAISNESIIEHAESYPNVEVVAVSGTGFSVADFWLAKYRGLSHSGNEQDPLVKAIYSDSAAITYKIKSTQPQFNELQISLATRSADNSVVAVCGGTTAECVAGGDASVTGTVLRKYISDKCVEANDGSAMTVAPIYGDTITLKEEITGLSEYYIKVVVDSTAGGNGAIANLSFAEKVPAVSDETTQTLLDADFNKLGGNHGTRIDELLGDKSWDTEYCAYVGTAGDLTKFNQVDAASDATVVSTYNYIGSELVFKLTAPAGKVFKGICVSMDAKCSVPDTLTDIAGGTPPATTNQSASITSAVGDWYENHAANNLNVVDRMLTYRNEDGSPAAAERTLTRDINTPAFVVAGNNQSEMYYSIFLSGADRKSTYLRKLKIEGIFGDAETIPETENECWLPLLGDDFGRYGIDGKDVVDTDSLRTHSDKFANVEVVEVGNDREDADCLTVRHWPRGTDPHTPAIKQLTTPAQGDGAYVTYKIASTRPDGFEALRMSFRARGIMDSYVKVYGSDKLSDLQGGPLGTDTTQIDSQYLLKDYVGDPDVFGGGMANPQTDNCAVASDWGETITLTEQVAGKRVYFVKFLLKNDSDTWGSVGDISFSEKVEDTLSDKIGSAYTTQTLLDANYKNIQTGEGQDLDLGLLQVGDTENGQTVAEEGELIKIFATPGDGESGALSQYTDDGSSSIVYKFTVPEAQQGKLFKGLKVTMDGKCRAETEKKASRLQVAVASYYLPQGRLPDTIPEGDWTTVKDFYAYKNPANMEATHQSVTSVPVKSTFIIPVNETAMRQDEIYLKISISSTQRRTTNLQSLKVEGIFGEPEFAAGYVEFGGEDVVSAISADGTLTAKTTIAFADDAASSCATLLVAVYDRQNGYLVRAAMDSRTAVPAGMPIPLKATVNGLDPARADDYFVKAFLWDSVNGMTPLTDDVYMLGSASMQ